MYISIKYIEIYTYIHMILITNIKYNKILIKINDLYCCMNVIN